MPETLLVVATCSERKALPVPAYRRLRSISRRGGTVARAKTWWTRLTEGNAEALAAGELYQGDHWSVVKELPELARDRGLRAELWVISAGYGLLPADAMVRSYAATFSPRESDSVASGPGWEAEAQAWWSTLASRSAPWGRGAPRRLATLVENTSRPRVLLIGSAEYLRAIAPDLSRAAAQLRTPDHFAIVTARADVLPDDVASHVIQTEARLRRVVGGGAQALNARVARWMVGGARSHGLDVSVVRRRLKKLLEGVRAVPTHEDRTPMSDAEVLDYITRELGAEAKPPGWTPLLRRLRKQGRKCEQNRFRALYQQVAGVKRAR